MRLNKMVIPIGALAVVLSAGSLSAEAAQRNDHRDRGGRNAQGQAQQRSRDGRGTTAQAQRGNDRDSRRDERQQQPRGDVRDRHDDRARPLERRGGNIYIAPRIVPSRPAYRHYYGSGGNLSVYFGLGSGFRYGSPYSGRVYGYSAPYSAYATRRYYGDVRLQVRPRDAAVYVDGYYAGIVDNFDGVFQRLTLEAGPHQIEIEAPGLEPRVFDVYVDPTRTVDLRADLY